MQLVAGAELPGIDIMMPLVATTRVTGLVTTAAGAPAPRTVVTIARVDDGDQYRGGLGWVQRADAGGQINVRDLFPGAYVARARVVTSGDAAGTMQWADTPFVADGRDVSVSLRLQPGDRAIGSRHLRWHVCDRQSASPVVHRRR